MRRERFFRWRDVRRDGVVKFIIIEFGLQRLVLEFQRKFQFQFVIVRVVVAARPDGHLAVAIAGDAQHVLRCRGLRH